MANLTALECDLADLPAALTKPFAAFKKRPCKVLLIALPDNSSPTLGMLGGKARAAKLNSGRRKEIAKQAARTRWNSPATNNK